MKRFLLDSLLFIFVVFIFIGLTDSSSTYQNNDSVNNYDQIYDNDETVDNGYIEGDINESNGGNTISKATYYVSDKVVDIVNEGFSIFKSIIKTLLD